MNDCNRRDFLIASAAAAAGLAGLSGRSWAADPPAMPAYLKGYEDLYRQDPAAATQWFREAKFGLFMHYGLYSLLGRHEWVQLREKDNGRRIREAQGQVPGGKVRCRFHHRPRAGPQMKYVNITTRHHDSFCLFDTKQTDFHSVNSPAKRDLVGELAVACRKKGLGLCQQFPVKASCNTHNGGGAYCLAADRAKCG